VFIEIIAIGKLKEKYLRDGVDEYLKRLAPYAKVSVTELPDEKTPDGASPAEEALIRQREGERVLARLKPDAHVIALAIDGELWSSEQFAAELERLSVYGSSRVAFVIGGSLGLSGDVLRRADRKLSFGRLTLPHQIMRLVLTEQIYRAFKIMRGEPYHK